MLRNSLNPGQHIREIKVFKAYENLARQAEIHSSKTPSEAYKIIDGNCEKKQLCYFKINDFIILDLKRQVNASRFRFYLEHWGAHQFTIEISKSGDSWEMLFDESQRRKKSTNGPLILNFPKQSFRYIRLKMLGTSGGDFKIREFEVL